MERDGTVQPWYGTVPYRTCEPALCRSWVCCYRKLYRYYYILYVCIVLRLIHTSKYHKQHRTVIYFYSIIFEIHKVMTSFDCFYDCVRHQKVLSSEIQHFRFSSARNYRFWFDLISSIFKFIYFSNFSFFNNIIQYYSIKYGTGTGTMLQNLEIKKLRTVPYF